MECTFERNRAGCTCTYDCEKRGHCCECVAYHRSLNQIPGCFFSNEGESAWDRSVRRFIEDKTKG